jgi:DNA transposition AAA+ family ATPase
VSKCQVLFYTPGVVNSPGKIQKEVISLRERLESFVIEDICRKKDPMVRTGTRRTWDPTVLIVVDEADRLRMASLEQMRAVFDEGGIGLVLIGMPGIEKRLARYPQFYSRVGFVHQFRPMTDGEVRRLLKQQWKPIGVTLPKDGIADEEALAAILRITGGNFRLLHRLLTQIGRILEINGLQEVTPEVVEAARESLVIGTV